MVNIDKLLFCYYTKDMKNFTKNDNGFVCAHCGKNVEPLGYTSRDHCPYCLTSIHIDINPGDRANTCLGKMFPIDIEIDSKKGYKIKYLCSKCGKTHFNKSATDDSFKTILSVMNHTYDKAKFN